MNFIDSFYDWMLKKGKISKRGKVPSTPLSKQTAKNHMVFIRRILVDLGYLKKIKDPSKSARKDSGRVNNKCGFCYIYRVHSTKYPDIKHIRQLSLNEIEDWIDKEFLDLNDRKELTRKASYIYAAWKFGEFLYFELKYWKAHKLKRLKERIYPPELKYHEIETVSPELVDKFIDWMEIKSYKTHVMLYLSRWCGGMRIGEIVRARSDLRGEGGDKGGTFIVDWDLDKCTIYGKGEGGYNKDRTATITDKVKQKLKDYLRWKKENNLNSKYLFENRYGEQISERSSWLCTYLKECGKESGLFKPDQIKLLSFHPLGRHTFGTYFSEILPQKQCMAEMGIENASTFDRYNQIQHYKDRGNKMAQAIENQNGDKKQDEKKSDFADLISIIKDLPKDEKVKLIAELLGGD